MSASMSMTLDIEAGMASYTGAAGAGADAGAGMDAAMAAAMEGAAAMFCQGLVRPRECYEGRWRERTAIRGQIAIADVGRDRSE